MSEITTVSYAGLTMRTRSQQQYRLFFDSAPIEGIENPVLPLTDVGMDLRQDDLGDTSKTPWGVTLKCRDMIEVFEDSMENLTGVPFSPINAGGSLTAAVFDMTKEFEGQLQALKLYTPEYVPHCIVVPPIGGSRSQRGFIRSLANMMVGQEFTFDYLKVFSTRIYLDNIQGALSTVNTGYGGGGDY